MTDPGPPQWERMVLEKVALKAIEEQRRTRQWNALFRLLWLTFAFVVLAAMLGWVGPSDKDSGGRTTIGKHTAVIDVEGVISEGDKASFRVFSFFQSRNHTCCRSSFLESSKANP
jgi:protease-4